MNNLTVKSIEITAFRGIKHEKIDLNSNSLVLLGENGTGKSSFVNAFEFLFSSKVASLTGSADVNHDKAIVFKNCQEEDLSVKLTFENGFTVERRFNDLICDSEIEDILPSFQKGSFLLNRKKLLKFIDSQPKQRYDAIGGLFDLNDLDDIEITIRKTTNALKKNVVSKKEEFIKETIELADLLGVKISSLPKSLTSKAIEDNYPLFKDKDLFKIIDELNNQLKDNDFNEIDFNSDLDQYWVNFQNSLLEESNIQVLNDVIAILNDLNLDITIESLTNLVKTYEKLSFESLKSIDDLLSILSSSKDYLLLTGSETCPVCDSPINNGELTDKLANKITDLDNTSSNLKQFKKEADSHLTNIQSIKSNAELLNAKLKELNMDYELNLEEIAIFKENLTDFKLFKTDSLDFNVLINLKEIIENIRRDVDSLTQESNISQIDKLSKSIMLLIQLKKESIKIASKENQFNQSTIVYDTFREMKIEYIENILASIIDRINKYYYFIHGEDQIKNPNIIVYSSNGLKLKINSFDLDADPREYSSEGHLDTLGLCIFLAFVREYNEIPFIVLDDIIATVDLSHKERIARLLLEEFSDYQIIITTHNKLWYRQIEQLSKALKNNKFQQIEITDWNIHEGPYLATQKSDTDLIEKYLKDNELNAAANAIRRFLENVTKNICLANRAQIYYKDRYSALDYFNAAQNAVEYKTRQTPFNKYYKDIFNEIRKTRYISNALSHDDPESDLLTNKEVRDLADGVIDLFIASTCEKCGSYLEFNEKAKKATCTNKHCRSSFNFL